MSASDYWISFDDGVWKSNFCLLSIYFPTCIWEKHGGVRILIRCRGPVDVDFHIAPRRIISAIKPVVPCNLGRTYFPLVLEYEQYTRKLKLVSTSDIGHLPDGFCWIFHQTSTYICGQHMIYLTMRGNLYGRWNDQHKGSFITAWVLPINKTLTRTLPLPASIILKVAQFVLNAKYSDESYSVNSCCRYESVVHLASSHPLWNSAVKVFVKGIGKNGLYIPSHLIVRAIELWPSAKAQITGFDAKDFLGKPTPNGRASQFLFVWNAVTKRNLTDIHLNGEGFFLLADQIKEVENLKQFSVGGYPGDETNSVGIPSLDVFQHAIQDNTMLKSICLDRPRTTSERVRSFFNSYSISYPIPVRYCLDQLCLTGGHTSIKSISSFLTATLQSPRRSPAGKGGLLVSFSYLQGISVQEIRSFLATFEPQLRYVILEDDEYGVVKEGSGVFTSMADVRNVFKEKEWYNPVDIENENSLYQLSR